MTRVDIERGPSMFGMSRSLSQQIINLNLIVEEKLSCAVCARISCWNVQKMSAESQLAQVALAPSPFQKVKLGQGPWQIVTVTVELLPLLSWA